MPISRILIAPYAFKGTVAAADAARILSETIRHDRPDLHCRTLPLGDGGRGTLDALAEALEGTTRIGSFTHATGALAPARWALLSDGRGVIEAAECIGIDMVPVANRRPELLTSRGVGEMIRAASRVAGDGILIGLGDTATHDCGLGMGAALGYRFLDRAGRVLEPLGASLTDLASVDADDAISLSMAGTFTVLCDVDAPLTGPDGAARLFASQKGADERTVERLEEGSIRFAEVVRRDLGRSVSAIPGAGAGGGLGAGLAAFLDATLEAGGRSVLDLIGFDSIASSYDLVITGEGWVDRQTLLGKGVAQVVRRGHALGKPVAVIAAGADAEGKAFLESTGATLLLLPERTDATHDHQSDFGTAARALISRFG